MQISACSCSDHCSGDHQLPCREDGQAAKEEAREVKLRGLQPAAKEN